MAILKNDLVQFLVVVGDGEQVLAAVCLVAAFLCLGIAAWWTIKNPRHL
jgi:hypothetical protein